MPRKKSYTATAQKASAGQPREPREQLRSTGKRFAHARASVRPKLTQVALAKLVGIHQSAVSRFENGERGLELENLLPFLRVSAEHGIDLNYVFTGRGEPIQRKTLVISAVDELEPSLLAMVDAIRKHSK